MYQDYGSSARSGSINQGLNNLATNTGLALGSFSNFPAMNALRAALPMVQAFLIMGVIISLPLILLVSTYKLKTVMTVTFALFTLHMLSSGGKWHHWVASSMLDTLYNQVSASNQVLLSLPTSGFMDGTVTAQVIEYVMGAMFLVLPGLFLVAMSWAGYSIGNSLRGDVRWCKQSRAWCSGQRNGSVDGCYEEAYLTSSDDLK